MHVAEVDDETYRSFGREQPLTLEKPTFTKCRKLLRSLSYDAISRHTYAALTHEARPAVPATASATLVHAMLSSQPTAMTRVCPACANTT